MRLAFALDCCNREAMTFLATTGGISGDDVRDLMVAAVEHRFGRVNRLPVTIEWLSDNGSCYIAGCPLITKAQKQTFGPIDLLTRKMRVEPHLTSGRSLL